MTRIWVRVEIRFVTYKIDQFFSLFPWYWRVGLSVWYSIFWICHSAFSQWESIMWGESPAHSLLSRPRVQHSCAGPSGNLDNICSASTLTNLHVGDVVTEWMAAHLSLDCSLCVGPTYFCGWQQRKHHVLIEQPLPGDDIKIQFFRWCCGFFRFCFSEFLPLLSTSEHVSCPRSWDIAVSETGKISALWEFAF